MTYLRSDASRVRLSESWYSLFETKEDYRFCFDVRVPKRSSEENIDIRIQIVQLPEKEQATISVFSAFKYHFIQFCYLVHTNDQKHARELQVKEAVAQHSQYSPGCDFKLDHWRCSNLKEFSMLHAPFFFLKSLLQPIEGNLHLLWNELAVSAVHKVLGFVFQLQLESGREMTFVEETILAYGR